eukprot:1164959-Prymnesium_polylepis.1
MTSSRPENPKERSVGGTNNERPSYLASRMPDEQSAIRPRPRLRLGGWSGCQPPLCSQPWAQHTTLVESLRSGSLRRSHRAFRAIA